MRRKRSDERRRGLNVFLLLGVVDVDKEGQGGARERRRYKI